MAKFSRPILMILINLTFGLIGHSQVVDGTILNSKESENDPYIELLKQASISGHKEENDKAIEYLSQAISMRPNESVGYNQRGYQRLKMKYFNGAIEDFTKGIELSSDNKKPFGYLSRGIVKYESEDYLGALVDFQMSISYKPDHGYTYYYLGLTYLKLGNKDKGCESFLIGKNLKDKHSKKSWKENCK